MRQVIIEIRSMSYEGQQNGLSTEQSRLLEHLSDAIHNIPQALTEEKSDIEFHTDIMLGGFEAHYPEHRIQSYQIYQRFLERSEKPLF